MSDSMLALILVLGGMTYPDLLETIDQGTEALTKELQEHLSLATKWNNESMDPDSQEAAERVQVLAKREASASWVVRHLTPKQKATVAEAAKQIGISPVTVREVLAL